MGHALAVVERLNRLVKLLEGEANRRRVLAWVEVLRRSHHYAGLADA